MARREDQKLDKRDRIIAAAWKLFTKRRNGNGYDDTTTKAIADKAGIATGTLFLYAPDKADLLALIYHDRIARAVETSFATLPLRAPLLDQLVHLFGCFFRMYGEAPSLSKRFIGQLMLTRGPNAERVNLLTFTFLARLQGLLLAAQTDGQLGKDVPLVLLGASIFGLYFNALTSWVFGYTDVETSVDPLLRGSLQLLLDGARG